MERWIEERLRTIYPTTEFHFNRKDAIKSELDIFVPSLMVAFELNGIFHYEPIFGGIKLAQIKSNDQCKFAKCHEAGIDLCIIDVSYIKYFKPKHGQKILDIITKIINEKS